MPVEPAMHGAAAELVLIGGSGAAAGQQRSIITGNLDGGGRIQVQL
jgi:hypothetical protein